MTPTVQNLISRAAQYDPQLAEDIRQYAQNREYGLIFEHNRPETMRLYGKPISIGDRINILPERGQQEATGNHEEWTVISKHDDTATISNSTGQTQNAPLADLVALADYRQPIYAGLTETGRVEHGEPTQPYQMVINGENYHALELLLFPYAGKVDCIYIDPPYNTGAKDWKYNNDYVGGDDAYRHSKWLAFMERRLKLAKQLLNPQDSVLIVTIDEKEYLRLGLLLEQVFPEARIQMITAVISPKGSARGSIFSRSDEYIFYVFLGEAHIVPNNDDMLHEKKEDRGVRWAGLSRQGTNGRRSARPNLFYPIFFHEADGSYAGIGDSLPRETNRDTVAVPEGCFAVFPLGKNGDEMRWGINPEAFKDKYAKGYIKFGPWKEGSTQRSISHLQTGTIAAVESGDIEILGRDVDGTLILGTVEKTVKPMTTWTKSRLSAGDFGSTLLRSLIPGHSFPFPKSLYAVEDSLRFVVANKPDALVVDFFSGSGTTMHAVMRLNHADGGHRQCICVTNNEVSADEEKSLTKQGKRHGDPEWEALGICEYITKPRITAAITGKTPEGDPIKGSYKFNDEFPIADGLHENAVFYNLEYLSPDSIELGLAYQQIAPLLWMRAGAHGPILDHIPRGGYALSGQYGLLTDWTKASQFIASVKADDTVRTVYVVTDDPLRYQSMCAELPDHDVVQLYESYLQSFKIAAEGAMA